MTKHFQNEIERLKKKILYLAAMVEENLRVAVKSITDMSVKEFEDCLRDAGLSRKEAKAVIAEGYKGLVRDAQEPEEKQSSDASDILAYLNTK